MPKKLNKRGCYTPTVCPNCGRQFRKFRTIRALVAGSLVKKLEPSHHHLTFAGVCGGMHLHVCAVCDTRFTTIDSRCGWREPEQLQPGWTVVKASQCEIEDLPSESELSALRKVQRNQDASDEQ